jgi:dUTPase
MSSLPIIYYKKIDKDSQAPIKANETDAGYDIFAHSGPRIVGKALDDSNKHFSEISYIEYGIGLVFEPINKDHYIQIYPRSSISKYNLVLANSIPIIDFSFRQEVLLRFRYLPDPADFTFDNGRVFVTVNQDKIYQKGNKIAQIIPSIVSSVNFIEVNKITESSRGGFGSSGK